MYIHTNIHAIIYVYKYVNSYISMLLQVPMYLSANDKGQWISHQTAREKNFNSFRMQQVPTHGTVLQAEQLRSAER